MIRIRPLDDADHLRALHRTLLTQSFRPGELLSEDDFVTQFQGDAIALVADSGASRMHGLAVLEPFSTTVLLQYLAVDPGARGQGIGSQLLQRSIEAAATMPGAPLLLAEFDRPDARAAHPRHGDPEARLRFYDRFGARALHLPYFQPAITEGMHPEHGMLLAVFDTEAAVRGSLTVAQSRAVQSYLHAALEGARDPDAARLRAAVDAAADIGIAVHRLSDYGRIPRSSQSADEIGR